MGPAQAEMGFRMNVFLGLLFTISFDQNFNWMKSLP